MQDTTTRFPKPTTYGPATLVALGVIWGIVPLGLSLIWLFLHVVLPGFGGLQQAFGLWIAAERNPAGGAFLMWLAICLLASTIALFAGSMSQSSSYSSSRHLAPVSRVMAVGGWVGVVAFLATIVGFGITTDLSAQTAASFYDRAAVVESPSIANPPGSLQYLLGGARKAANGCWVAPVPVPNCTRVGTMPTAGFDPRVSSAAGALLVMQRTSGARQNVNLMASSLTYLNGDGKNGVWSAIRDGFGAFQPTEGVVEWNGRSLPSECRFGGRDRFDKAFDGVKSNSLINDLGRAYPTLYARRTDVWGYCTAAKRPVLVLPVSRQATYGSATVSVPAGVLVLRGSPSGNPRITYERHASGLPGPVYPRSVADAQLAALNYLAGHARHDRNQFGFEPTTASAQAGNTSEYLLRSRANGHVYWVTPLTLSASRSQLFVAYAVVRADTVSAGRLNRMTLYALSANDPRAINIDQLEAVAKTYMVDNAGGFIPSGGRLIEFTPAQGDYWRAFGEINGRVIYRLDISANASETPTLVSLNPLSGAPTTVSGATGSPGAGAGTGAGAGRGAGRLPAYCTQSVASLTTTEKVACAQFFLGLVTGP